MISHFAAGVSNFSRSLLIFSTIPALRSATSLTLYSADVPNTCATSDGVNLYSSDSHCAIFAVAPRNASSSDPASPIAMICVADSTRIPASAAAAQRIAPDVPQVFPVSPLRVPCPNASAGTCRRPSSSLPSRCPLRVPQENHRSRPNLDSAAHASSALLACLPAQQFLRKRAPSLDFPPAREL